jgi:hypothetical protein
MSFLGQLAAGFAQTRAAGLYGQRERQAEDFQQGQQKAVIAQRAAELLRNQMLDQERMKDADTRLGLEQMRIDQSGRNADAARAAVAARAQAAANTEDETSSAYKALHPELGQGPMAALSTKERNVLGRAMTLGPIQGAIQARFRPVPEGQQPQARDSKAYGAILAAARARLSRFDARKRSDFRFRRQVASGAIPDLDEETAVNAEIQDRLRRGVITPAQAQSLGGGGGPAPAPVVTPSGPAPSRVVTPDTPPASTPQPGGDLAARNARRAALGLPPATQ